MMTFKTKIDDEMGLGENGEVMPTEAIGAVLHCNETELCFVGFLLRVIAAVENNMTIFDRPFALVIELHYESASKNKSLKGGGTWGCLLQIS
jgi:hypothetical protein